MSPFRYAPLALLVAAPAAAQTPAPSAAAPTATADAALYRLIDDEYAWRRQSLALGDAGSGERSFRLADVGPPAQAERLRRWTDTAAALQAVPAQGLSPAARIDRAVYAAQIQALLDAQGARDWQMPVNSDSSFWSDLAGTARGTFRTERDYRAYIAMLRDVPRYYDQQIANMAGGLARGFTPPRITLEGRDSGIATVAQAASPDASPFFQPFLAFAPGIAPVTQSSLRAEAAAAIRDAVTPAHAKLLAFWRTRYLPGARTTIAAADLPDGAAWYRSKVRIFTTLDRTPDQVHATGLAEVAKITAEMEQARAAAGFKGDLPAFLTFLRTDPRFYAATPQALLDRAAWTAKQFDGKAAAWFGRLPRARFAIRPVAPEIAPFYTAGRGGLGVYLLNTYDLPSRPLYQLPALTLHESAPGHAFQIPLSAENTALKPFRRNSYVSAYGEGWALYTERLGDEMGLYETPYERFGMLSYQMWRAVRLVVDTGMHAKGWSRDRAIAYLRDHTALSTREVTTEVDRYISWPGQALSYYTGEMAFFAARRRAERALGDRFDIRQFHDAMLALGSVPLPVLDLAVDDLVARGGKGPYAREATPAE
jgi:uncharacterized protein (DUF885 family)